MKKRSLLSITLVIITLLFTTSTALAAAPTVKPTPKPKNDIASQGKPDDKGGKQKAPQHLKGTVTGVSATSITLKLADGTSVDIGLDSQTRINIPTVKNATWSQINLNVQAVVQARPDATTGLPVAMTIMVVPGKPVHFHRVGTVTIYNPNVDITIQDKDGQTTTFLLAPQAKILPLEQASKLAVGAKVTIISRRDPTGGPLTAQGVVVHPDGDTQETSDTD